MACGSSVTPAARVASARPPAECALFQRLNGSNVGKAHTRRGRGRCTARAGAGKNDYATDVQTPHLDAFAERSCVFDNHWIGSAPCMPARRDILTGRYNFLERPWGPIEPFDVTLPQCLRAQGAFCHITTDHCHYLRTGGEGYLQEFNTWDYYRGQEGDPWVSRIDEPDNMPETFYGRVREQYQKNRQLWPNEEDMPSPKTFQSACDWIDGNAGADDFFLMVEAFDPHEPFDVPDKYMEMYGGEEGLDRDYFEIPLYKRVSDTDVTPEAKAYIQRRYKALVTMTDRWFGKLIDTLEANDMLDDTLVMVTTDHGYFLCGSTAYIDEMEAALPDAPLPEQARLCQLLALQYESRGDHPRADEYHARAKKAFERALKQ